jgi:lipid II:glycine glycyltransferase (peptidoglycan interpeptide bridge formation enzyme)
MQIKQITDNNFAKEWDEFVMANSSPASFLQSWKYGENKKSGDNLLRLAVFYNNELIAVAQFFKIALPGGKFYLDCKRGPVLKKQEARSKKQEILKIISDEIQSMSKKENLVFFRIAGDGENFIKPKILTNLIEPKKSLLLNLEKSEEEILSDMKQKTRYNIRLAEKKEIRIKNIESRIKEKYLDEFYSLMQETAKRDKINIFKKEYYENLLKLDEQKNLNCKLFVAEHENEILSAIIVLGFGNTATYFYGASSNEKRNLMPNYLIQWSAIKWAKKQGYKWYDFWGISENKNKWTGITKFKFGFVSEETGREVNYNVNDFVLNKKWYTLYRVGKLISRIKFSEIHRTP